MKLSVELSDIALPTAGMCGVELFGAELLGAGETAGC